MNELITISYENETPSVRGRELHEFLEVGTEYRHWFPRMCEYGFSEQVDYTPVIFDHPQNHQQTADHLLTIEMAKELCMLQRNDKGKQARQYFVQLEKAWNTPEQVMARALKLADKQIAEVKKRAFALEQKIEELRPKELFADAVAVSHTTILIGDLAKLIRQNGFEIGQNRLFEILRDEGYLCNRRGSQFNAPTQRAMDMKLFRVKETVITHSDGHTSINKTTKVTGKGQIYFINRFCGRKDTEYCER